MKYVHLKRPEDVACFVTKYDDQADEGYQGSHKLIERLVTEHHELNTAPSGSLIIVVDPDYSSDGTVWVFKLERGEMTLHDETDF